MSDKISLILGFLLIVLVLLLVTYTGMYLIAALI